MLNAVSRRRVLRSLAVVAVYPFGSARCATPAPADEADPVQVPHFGNGKVRGCVPRVRLRIRAVLDDKNPGRFDHQPPANNRACK
jgi:hypothetical protein